MTVSLLLEITIFKVQLLQNVLPTHFSVMMNKCWVVSWILKNDSLSLEEEKRISQKQIYIKLKCSWHYWADLPVGPVERDLLCMYVCLQVQGKKKKNSGKVAKAPTRHHILEMLSCKEPQPPPTTITLANTKLKPFQACYG